MSVKTVASTCQGCLTNCPVIVTLSSSAEGEGSWAVDRVAGNPESAVSCGTVCPNVAIAKDQCNDPDRVLYPMRRTNPRKGRHERPEFERITWDEALGQIADRLLELRRRGEGQRVAFAKGRSTGISGLIMKALPDIYGTPNRFGHDSFCAEAEKLATGCLDGVWDYHGYDFAHAQHVLMWGTDPVASNRMKGRFLHDLSDLRKHARLVVVSPHRSATVETACAAWLPVIPGTDGTLACAMAHVILTEGLWNRSYVGDFRRVPDASAGSAQGERAAAFVPGQRVDADAFEERGVHGLVLWWNEALMDMGPDAAAPLCGIDADTIREQARAFAAAGPQAVSWVSPGVTMCARGIYSGMACYALNGLVGSPGATGGVLTFPSVSLGGLPATDPFQDAVAREANRRAAVDRRHEVGFAAAKEGKLGSYPLANTLADCILDGAPYELDTVIAYWVNWAYSCTGAQRWEQALAKLPFFVHVTCNLSETSQFADIVLPARHHLFEDWGFARSRQGGAVCVTIEQPSVSSPGECRGDETDVPFDLALALAKRGFDAPLRYYRSLKDPCTGVAPNNGRELGEAAVKVMLRPLWDTGGEPASAWEEFRVRGVWDSASVQPRVEGDPVPPLPTPTGRFEFASEHLRALLADYAAAHNMDVDTALASLGYEARGALAYLPHGETPVRIGSESDFPLIFSQHRSRVSLEGRAANTRRFQRLKGSDPGDEPWDDVLKVHPDDMAMLGLTSGDEVRVTSVQGSIACRVKEWDGTRPGVVVKCYGQGHWAYGHVAALDFDHGVPRGGNNNELLPPEWERISAATARHGGLARVKVQRVAGGPNG